MQFVVESSSGQGNDDVTGHVSLAFTLHTERDREKMSGPRDAFGKIDSM
jgi:hypothetical protein